MGQDKNIEGAKTRNTADDASQECTSHHTPNIQRSFRANAWRRWDRLGEILDFQSRLACFTAQSKQISPTLCELQSFRKSIVCYRIIPRLTKPLSIHSKLTGLRSVGDEAARQRVHFKITQEEEENNPPSLLPPPSAHDVQGSWSSFRGMKHKRGAGWQIGLRDKNKTSNPQAARGCCLICKPC